MRMYIGGQWVDRDDKISVVNPYDSQVIDTVPRGTAADVAAAIASAVRGAAAMRKLTGYDRFLILRKAADLIEQRTDEFGRTITLEEGKTIFEGRAEAGRAVQTISTSGEEAKRIHGETVPLDGAPGYGGQLAFTMRVPCGIVAAISPFNFPLNLVAHKLGPALAAGNSVVLKPAGQTPASGLKLAELLIEAGVPDGWLNVVTGPGSEVGNALVEHELTAAISFTGSAPVGWEIRRQAVQKKVSLELGSTAPLIVMEDGDWERAADGAGLHAFSHAGQSCISIQRILVHADVAEQFTERLIGNVEKLVVGDPMSEETDVGPLITQGERDRVKEWIEEADAGGGEILTGGQLVDEDRCLAPTVIREPSREAQVWCAEIFGPVATLHTVTSLDEAIGLANDSNFGLHAGIFTRDIGRGLEASKRLEFGGVLINEVPTFRADQMPYGGVKESGNTREGPAYSVHEFTEERFVSLQG